VDEAPKRRVVTAAPLNAEQRASRMIAALLSSLDQWIIDLGEVESVTVAGSKRHVLHLTRSLAQMRLRLRQISGLEPEDPPPQ
jgi:hypothetical protein